MLLFKARLSLPLTNNNSERNYPRREMTSKSSPVFPVPEPEPEHYSDYGFDPQISYFQFLEEARRHRSRKEAKSLDGLHFKLQKPISKDDSKHNKNKKRSRWWRTALHFWKWKRSSGDEVPDSDHLPVPAAVAVASTCASPSSYYYYPHRAVSGPVYVTESAVCGSCTSTPRRSSSRPSSGPLEVTEMGEVEIPYLCLRDLNVVEGHRISASSGTASSSMPIYLVT